ncbi:MAG: hypothetical protein IKT52_01385 [Oscillospiraceae bacterium]|nr:hypothetical protein [Oscillospiraceae bacterium]
MNTELEKNPVTTEEENKKKKNRSVLLWVLLGILLFLFLLTSIVLGSRLYDMATRDRYTVDLGLGELDGSIELFRIEYQNESGEITVQGANADNVVAPGTSVSYDVRLRNNEDVIIDFLMCPTVDFLTDDSVPVEFRIVDDYGNYILGSEDAWVSAEAMNTLAHKGSIHPGEVFTYHVQWQWVFEVDAAQDNYDTYLGNQSGDAFPGVAVGIETQSTANPKPVKSNAHMMHLLGEGFGCCWCCWLVWILLLVCIALLVWIWTLHRKMNRQTEKLDEYEKLLHLNSIVIDA